MTFIITLISLIIERFLHWSHLRNWHWFNGYQKAFSRFKMPPLALLILAILPPVLLTGLVNLLLAGWLHGALKVVFGTLVLVYCLGPANLWVQVYRFINQSSKPEDSKSAMETVQAEWGMGPVDDAQAFHQAFTRLIFIEAYQRIFAVVFWFVVLGPMGAVLYRTIALMGADSPLGLTDKAKKIQQWLDWAPVRVLTFIFALGGRFTQVMACWKQTVLKGPETNQATLVDCGIAALEPTTQNPEQETITLLDRTFGISLAVLAIGVLIL